MSDKVTVFHLITRFKNGGAEKTTWNEIQTLSRTDKYDISLGYGKDYNSEKVSNVSQSGISTHSFQLLRHYNFPALVLAVLEVAFVLWREDVEILHTHSTEAGVVGRIAGVIAGVPVILHEIHGDPITSDRNSLLNSFILQLERWCARFTTIFISKSEKIKMDYLERGIGRKKQYSVIYHGVELDRFDVDQTPSNVPPTEGSVVTFVGRIEDGKGVLDLVSAFKNIKSSEDHTLFIVGRGKKEKEVEKKISEVGLDSSAHLLGYREDVPELLNITDVLVLPSYREGTPRVITEARAAGLPVVSTNIAGIPEQINDGTNGYLVTPGDVPTLAARLEELLSSESLREQFSDNATTGLEQFDRQTVSRELRDLYSDVCKERLV